MIHKILTTTQAPDVITKLHEQDKKIVLIGGCFDILHIGHITFLETAKKEGDVLIVLLEHDTTIKKMKGENRPINIQEDRAKILAAIAMIDYVILLPTTTDNAFYDNLVIQIKPAIIATTQGDPNRHHKERQAKQVGAKVVDVTLPIHNKSTTHVITLLKEL